MSWYNDDPENDFIDATQEFTGGGVSTSVSIIQNTEDLVISETVPDTEEETTIGNVLLPAVLNPETGTYDLYIRNVNQGGKIFLTTRGTSEKVKIENGLLYIYYNYDFFNAPTIPGGWTDIVNYLVATRQFSNANSVGVAAAAAGAATANTNAGIAQTEAISAGQLALAAEGSANSAHSEIGIIKARLDHIATSELSTSVSGQGTTANNSYRDLVFDAGQRAFTAATSGNRAIVAAERTVQFIGRTQIFLNIVGAMIGAGLLGSALSLVGILVDYVRKKQLDDELVTLFRDYENNVANYDSTTLDHIHLPGLQIVSATNGDFTTSGIYNVKISDDTYIEIEIDTITLLASIISVSGGKTNLLVNDTISISKQEDLGGSVSGTGDLELTIISLTTEKLAIEQVLTNKVSQLQLVESRIRRRQNIPTSSSFASDGFTITNTQITEPLTSEITNEPTISLKLDTNHFSYDATGNLQLTNHANIGYTGNLGIPSDPLATPPVTATLLNLQVETNTGNISTNTTNISTNTSDISTLQTSLGIASDSSANPPVTASGLYAIVEQNIADISSVTGGININQLQTDVTQNATDISALETVVGTLPIYDSDGNPVIISTGVFERLDNVYKIIMPEGFTYDNNDNYKLNLGYFTPWDNYKYDLICCALKGSRAGAFDSSFYGGDYLGFMPSLTRMNDVPNIAPVKDIGLQFTNDMFFKRGLLFIELSDPLVDYDLNRKLEFICFVKPTSIDNTGVEYTLLQTGVEFVNGDYELDTSKLKLAIRDNKLEVTHTVLASYDYWQPFPNRNFNNSSSFIARGGNGFGEKTSEFYFNNPAGHQQNWKVKDQQVYLNNVIFESRARVVLHNDTNTMQYYDSINQNHIDFNINLLETNSSGTHASPVVCYSENLAIDGTTRNNMAKIKIAFEYMQCSTAGNYNFYGNTLQFKTFSSLAQLNNELEFKWRISVGFTVPGNPPNILLTRDYDFDQITYAPQSVITPLYYGERFYMQELWMPIDLYPGLNGSPGYIQNYYNYIEIKLVHRGGTFTAPLSGTQPTEFFAGQHNIRVYGLNFFEYKFNQDTYDNYTPYTEVGTNDIFPSNYDPNLWYKLIFEIDLANRDIFYYVNNTPTSSFTYDATFVNVPHATINFPNSDQTIPYFYDATYQIVNNGDTGLIRNNNILVVGNEPPSGELQFSHFNFTFFQQPTLVTMTSAERLKLDNLIKYNYYYETVEIPRYLKVKEFYADVFDARRVLINGGFAYDDLTPAQQVNSIRSADQSSDNLSILNAFVNIDKLFVTDQTTSGSLDYNHLTKEFEIILRNNFEPSLYYDKTNTDLLFTSKIQFTDHFTPFNIFNSTFSRFELIDTKIELVDGDITYLYQHRERDTPNDPSLQIVTYFFNCVNNINISDATIRRFLYRDLITNVMPPLIGSTTNISPVCAYDFNNNHNNTMGSSSFDLVATININVVYGDPTTNQKSVSGLAGGSSVLEHPANYIFTTHNTISFIHRPIQLVSHSVINFKRADGQDTFIIAGVVQGSNFNYLLFLTNPNGGGAQTFLFSNPNNDTFVNNDNAIVLYNIDNDYFWYINGAFHGLITVSWSPLQAIEPSKLYLDLNNSLDANGILYDLKFYNQPLFEYPASTAEQQLFNKKRLIDITQFTRITDDADGNFVLKELTPYKTIKANSLKSGSAVTEKSVTTISSRRTIQEADVFKKVSETEKYQVFDTEVEVNGNLLLENVNNDVGVFFTIYTATQKQTVAGVNNFKDTSSIILDDSTNEWIFSRLPETANLTTSTTKFKHDTTDLLILKHNEVECGVGLKVGTITFADNSTLTTAPISSVYDDTDARSAVYPINQVNTGLPLISSGINVFDTDLWFNSTDGQRRLQFENNSDTIIHCPSGITNKIRFQHNGSERFSTGETLNKSSVSMQLGPSPYNTSPLRFAMIGANNRDVSSVIVFGDSGSYPYYTGMMIYYDSQFNKLKISADLDDDGNIDLEPAITIQRDDRYVGILKSMPDYPLDVVGDIQSSTTIRTPRIDFPDPLAFIKPEKFQIHGVGGQASGYIYETETFTNASGGTNTTMSGFNTNLFTNGSIGSATDVVATLGQINGLYGTTISQVQASGAGSGSSGDFDSLTSTGFSNYFIFNGGTDRLLRTKDISTLLSTTITISFNYITGNGVNGGNAAETGETFYLEFLNNAGARITRYTIHNGGAFYAGGTNFTAFQHTLQTIDKTATYVRWIQELTSTGNFDHYAINNIVFASSTLIPDPVGLFIKGPDLNTRSSVVCFGDNGTGVYHGGMTINYDSLDNKLQFGGDANDDGSIDASSAITILNLNKYVGILKDTPVYPLDVVGDIQTSTTIRTPRIDFGDGTNLTTALGIATNTTDIATNTTNIATNTTNIATNTTDIATNTTDIATNTTNIATNTTNIATNTADIATNTTNIATNTTNIATNTTNIATNTTNIATNTSDLVALNNNISTTHPSYIEFAKDLKLPNGDIISSVYDDTDVRTLLSTSAGTGLTWNATNNQFDNEDTLPNGAYMTSRNDNVDRLLFYNNGNTVINTPDTQHIVFKINNIKKLQVSPYQTENSTVFKTPELQFPDGSSMTTAPQIPSYLFAPSIWKYSLNSITNVNYIYSGSSNNYPAIFSGTGHVLLNLNAPLIINSANELKITIAGYYQIHISFRFRNNQGNNAIRASIQNFLEINGSFGLDRVATNYMRYTGNAECACTNQACLVEYFNVNDLVRIGFMKIGNSTLNCELFGTNSTITFQRIA